MRFRVGLVPVVVALSIIVGAAPAHSAPAQPSTAVQLLPARPVPEFLKALLSRWVKKPPAKIAATVARRQITGSATTWLVSGGTKCVFPLPKSFCAPPVNKWGLGQAVSWRGLPPGVWNSSYSRSYEVTRPLLVGEVYSLTCWQPGDRVAGPFGSTDLWYRVTSGGYVSDALLYTGTNNVIPGVRHC